MSAAPPARLIARRRCGQVRAIMPYAPDRSSRLCELSWLLRSRVGVHDHVAAFLSIVKNQRSII